MQLTDEQKVRAEYPDAYITGSYDMYDSRYDSFDVIVRRTGKTIGSGSTPRKAWADAARRLESDGNVAATPTPFSSISSVSTEPQRNFNPDGINRAHAVREVL